MKPGWETKRLGEVCSLISRGVAPRYVESGGICVLNQKCIRDHRINYDLARRHDVEAKPVKAERFIRLGDVLVNSTGEGTLGRVAQVREEPGEPTTVDTHVTIVRPKEKLFFPDFFGVAMIQIEAALTAAGEGASGQTELSRTRLRDLFSVEYPEDLAEQRRIVEVLDEAFAALATATANTQQALTSARELFHSVLDEKLDLAESFGSAVPLSSVFELQSGFAFPSSEYLSEGHRLVRIGNVQDGYIDLDAAKFVQLDSKTQKFGLVCGDILVSLTGNIGRVAVVDEHHLPAALNQRVARLRNRSNGSLDSVFAWLFLTSQRFRDSLGGQGHGTAQQNVSPKSLGATMLPLPSPDEQATLVAQMQEITAMTERMETNATTKLALLAELRQSLLARAFTGELT